MTTFKQAIEAYRTIATADGESPNTVVWVIRSTTYFARFLGDPPLSAIAQTSLQAPRISGSHAARANRAASYVFNKGGNLLRLQHLLGHTVLTMTKRYFAIAVANLTDAHRKVSPGTG